MANILRKIGDEFARSDALSLVAWLIVLIPSGALLLLGGLYSKSWMIVVAMALIGTLAIILIGKALYDFFSSWWDNMHSDERVEAKR